MFGKWLCNKGFHKWETYEWVPFIEKYINHITKEEESLIGTTQVFQCVRCDRLMHRNYSGLRLNMEELNNKLHNKNAKKIKVTKHGNVIKIEDFNKK